MECFGSMILHKSATLWLALGIMCPLSSLAVGLSSIHIHSALNQPFAAEIDVLGLRDMPIGDLNVQVANQELYQQMGLEKSFQRQHAFQSGGHLS